MQQSTSATRIKIVILCVFKQQILVFAVTIDIRNWADEMIDWKNQKINNINIAKELQKLVKYGHFSLCSLNSDKAPQVF